jgi:hypothetical protein
LEPAPVATAEADGGSDPDPDGHAQPDKEPPPVPRYADGPLILEPTATRFLVWPTAPASATAVPIQPGVIRPTRTPLPTTEPTPVVTRLPFASPTPHCGDPDAIAVRVGELTTHIEEENGSTVVRFHFDVRNASPFPVTLTSMAVVLQAGPDTFGSTSLNVVTIEPGAVYPVADRVTIERYPAPHERVEMCVSFVPETCGRSPIRRGNQCWRNIPHFSSPPQAPALP